MLRRKFIGSVAAGTSLGMIGIGCRSSDSAGSKDEGVKGEKAEVKEATARDTGEKVTLRLHQFLPPMATLPKQVLKPWADRVAKASGGRIEIQHFDAMSMGGAPPQLIDQATDGIADIVMTLPGYTPGRFPKTEVFELPFVMTSAEATSKALWALLREDLQDTEYKGLQVIGAWVHGPGVIHAKEAVKKLEDMKGMKLRGPTRVINDLLTEVGATPVGMPLPATAEAISKGVVSGTVIPWEVTPALKLAELVKHHTEFGGKEALYTAPLVLAMNKAKYDALPTDLKGILDAESGEKLCIEAAMAMTAADAPARKIAVDARNEIVTLDETEVARWKTASQPVIDRWLKEMQDREIDGKALLDKARSLIAKYG